MPNLSASKGFKGVGSVERERFDRIFFIRRHEHDQRLLFAFAQGPALPHSGHQFHLNVQKKHVRRTALDFRQGRGAATELTGH